MFESKKWIFFNNNCLSYLLQKNLKPHIQTKLVLANNLISYSSNYRIKRECVEKGSNKTILRLPFQMSSNLLCGNNFLEGCSIKYWTDRWNKHKKPAWQPNNRSFPQNFPSNKIDQWNLFSFPLRPVELWETTLAELCTTSGIWRGTKHYDVQ